MEREMEPNTEGLQVHRGHDEFCASLRIFGEELDPDEVSRLLGCAPTESTRRGDVVQRRTRSIMASQGFWRLSTENSAENIETQLLTLFARLTDDFSVWQSLTTRFDADLFCGTASRCRLVCIGCLPTATFASLSMSMSQMVQTTTLNVGVSNRGRIYLGCAHAANLVRKL